MYRLPTCLTFALMMVLPIAAPADEGMWLFNALPTKQLAERYEFTPTDDWVAHLQMASVRFNNGGSASFVSSDGLVITNHHVAADTLYKLSSEDRNVYADGFLARTREEELPAPDLELNQLVSIEDVTDRVGQAVAAVKDQSDTAAAAEARRAVIARIEAESLEATGLRSNVVTLYGGGRYHLYRFRRYTDVRLVWAPEAAAAFFGGDADNFEYPRYCLDVTIFRVYEDGKPANIDHFLSLDPAGAREGDLVFVSGNPGRTRRIYTTDALAYQRDIALPDNLDLLRRKEIMLQQFGLDSPEAKRRAQDELFGIQNARKAYTGMLRGLQDPQFFQRRRARQDELLAAIAGRRDLQTAAAAWEEIRQVLATRLALRDEYASLRGGLYDLAETIVLLAGEDTKPNEQRLESFRESNRESLLQQLYSPAPLYPDLERVQLADELARLAEHRGGDDPLVLSLLNGKSPEQRATEVVSGTKLFDVDTRKRLVQGGQAALKNSDDPAIVLAQTLEPEYRRLEEINRQLAERERAAYAKIAEAKFAVEGESVYPDATFTLRLAFGRVLGYASAGEAIEPSTKMVDAFEHARRHEGQTDYDLPNSWIAAKGSLDPQTPYNFVCTADIIGGNSGSPVVSRAGELVGVIFDGNLPSLSADYQYSDVESRAVAVHIAAVLEALRKIYDANELAESLGQ